MCENPIKRILAILYARGYTEKIPKDIFDSIGS